MTGERHPHLYRDTLLGLRARVIDLVARIEAQEARLAKTFWDMLPESLRCELASLREARHHVDTESLAELATAETKLTAYVDQLDRFLDDLPAMTEAWLERPDTVDDPPPPRSRLARGRASKDETDELQRAFTAMIRERAPDASIREDSRSYVARFRDRGCPFALRATLSATGNGTLSEVAMLLVTSIPRALPRLVVRYETFVLSIGKALGLKSEIEVGDPSFDGLFVVEGSRAAAGQYLVPSVRSHLLALSRFDVPTLEIEPERKVASIRWCFEPASKALEAAVRILRAVRETTPCSRFTT